MSTPDGALRSTRTNPDGSTEVTEMGADGSGSVDRVDAQGNLSTDLLEPDLRRGSGGVRDLDDPPAPPAPDDVQTSQLPNATEADFVTDDGTTVHISVDADGLVTRQTDELDPDTGVRTTTTRMSDGFDEVRVNFPDGREQFMRQQADGTSLRIDTLPQPDGSIRTEVFEDSPFPTSTEITTFDADGNQRTVRSFEDGRPEEVESVSRTTDAQGRTIVTETQADGTVDVRTRQPDGSEENVRILPDGSRELDTKTPLPGGGERTEMHRADGTVEVTERTVEGAGETRTERLLLDRDGNVTSSSVTDVRVDVDGTQTTETVDGSARTVAVVRADGTIDSRTDFTDGTSSTVVRTRDANGGFTQLATGQDGGVTETRQRTGSNGEAQLVVTRPDGTTVGAEITSDGAVSAGRVAPDGTRTRAELDRDGSGEVQQFDANGNQTDGREIFGDDAFGPDADVGVTPTTATFPAPADPTDPADQTDPADPTDPTDPADPTDPTDPTVLPASVPDPTPDDADPPAVAVEDPLDAVPPSVGSQAANAGASGRVGPADAFDEPDLLVNRIREQSEDSNVDHRPNDPLTPLQPVGVDLPVIEPEAEPELDEQPVDLGIIHDTPLPTVPEPDFGDDVEPLIRPDPDARPLEQPLVPMEVDDPVIVPAPPLDEQPVDLGIIHDTPLPTVPEPDFGDDVEPLIRPDPDARPLEEPLVPMEVDDPVIVPAPPLDEQPVDPGIIHDTPLPMVPERTSVTMWSR